MDLLDKQVMPSPEELRIAVNGGHELGVRNGFMVPAGPSHLVFMSASSSLALSQSTRTGGLTEYELPDELLVEVQFRALQARLGPTDGIGLVHEIPERYRISPPRSAPPSSLAGPASA